MEDWIDIIEGDGADDDEDRIVLPPPQTVDLNAARTLIKEIKYHFDEGNADNIIRTESKYELIEVKKKISKAAEARQKQWVKFGACAKVPKGTLERGITADRGIFPFDFNDRDGKQKRTKPVQAAPPPPKSSVQPAASMQMREEEHKAAETQPTFAQRRTFVPPHLRGGGYSMGLDDDEDKVEIKILNLPQWSEFMDVKRLIDEFRRSHLRQSYIPKYKIRMIPSKKTLETWHASPKEFARRLQDYERLAIVDFENEEHALEAIKVLNGHRYDNHVLAVERAERRNF